MKKSKIILLLGLTLLTGIVAAAGGVWVLLTPQNWLLRQFRGPIAQTSEGIVIGPYPLQDDLELLKANGVTLVISLMDPQLPYEKILIEREKRLAERLGLRFENYPMASVLGRQFGSHSDENAARAAGTAIDEKGRAYLHCYLGVHRVKTVENMIQAKGGKTARYAVRQSHWTPPPRP